MIGASEKIFPGIDMVNDPSWIVKEFFNSIHSQGNFLWALELLVSRAGCSINYDFCVFPDPEDFDADLHFEGVKVGLFRDEVVIPEGVFWSFLRQACDRYSLWAPEKSGHIKELLNRLS